MSEEKKSIKSKMPSQAIDRSVNTMGTNFAREFISCMKRQKDAEEFISRFLSGCFDEAWLASNLPAYADFKEIDPSGALKMVARLQVDLAKRIAEIAVDSIRDASDGRRVGYDGGDSDDDDEFLGS